MINVMRCLPFVDGQTFQLQLTKALGEAETGRTDFQSDPSRIATGSVASSLGKGGLVPGGPKLGRVKPSADRKYSRFLAVHKRKNPRTSKQKRS